MSKRLSEITDQSIKELDDIKEQLTDGLNKKTNKTNVIEQIAQNYNVDYEGAKKLLAFHYKTRASLNEQFAGIRNKDNFEQKKGWKSSLANAIGSLAEAIPIADIIIRPLAFILEKSAEKFEEKKKHSAYDALDKLDPAHDPESSAKISRFISDELISEDIIKEILACQDEEEVKKLAKLKNEKFTENLIEKNQSNELQDSMKKINEGTLNLAEFLSDLTKQIEVKKIETKQPSMVDQVLESRKNKNQDHSL
jgi:hypothetical protein